MSSSHLHDASDALGKAFLTDIDVRRKEPETRLDNVRSYHFKLMNVVSMLRGKVELMVDKQRTDFMTAYEHHIQDVVKEINYLREKVNEVANEKARQEKMDDLDKQQNAFKNEALTLDADTITLKKTLRILTGKIHSLEQDRDWILKRLRLCKDKFDRLKKEKQRRSGCDSLSMDNDSNSYILELTRDGDMSSLDLDGEKSLGGDTRYSSGNAGFETDNFDATKFIKQSKSTGQLHNQQQRSMSKKELEEQYKRAQLLEKTHKKMNQTFQVNRDPSILPQMGGQEIKKPVRLERLGSKANLMMPPQEVGPSTGKVNVYVPEINSEIPNTAYTSASAKARAKLVDLRTRQESIRDFVAHCSIGLGKGPWAKITPRPLDELMDHCALVVMDPVNREEERNQLAVELAGSIETYYALSDLMSGKYDHRNFSFGSQFERENFYGNNSKEGPYDIMVNSSDNDKEAAQNYFSDWGDLKPVDESNILAQSCDGANFDSYNSNGVVKNYASHNINSNSQGDDEYYDAANARDLAFDANAARSVSHGIQSSNNNNFPLDGDLAGYLSKIPMKSKQSASTSALNAAY